MLCCLFRFLFVPTVVTIVPNYRLLYHWKIQYLKSKHYFFSRFISKSQTEKLWLWYNRFHIGLFRFRSNFRVSEIYEVQYKQNVLAIVIIILCILAWLHIEIDVFEGPSIHISFYCPCHICIRSTKSETQSNLTATQQIIRTILWISLCAAIVLCAVHIYDILHSTRIAI